MRSIVAAVPTTTPPTSAPPLGLKAEVIGEVRDKAFREVALRMSAKNKGPS
jgi:hypothetical protein